MKIPPGVRNEELWRKTVERFAPERWTCLKVVLACSKQLGPCFHWHIGYRWGGSTRARVQLLVDVVSSVRSSIGKAVPVGIRISQGKVNDFTSKWPGGNRDAETIFGTLADAGVDFIHVTEREAWQPAFEGTRDSLVTLARRRAPNVTIFANGSLHTAQRMAHAFESGADIVTVGRAALANPDLPMLLASGHEPREFDGSILRPIPSIKDAELAM